MGKLDGKVAFITGAARGQGRSHALRLADEGADIIAVDICADIATVPYPLASESDLKQTAAGVADRGRKVVVHVVDVRDHAALQEAFDDGVRRLGRIDVVVANAGVLPMTFDPELRLQSWRDGIDIVLTGAFHTVDVAVETMREQGEGGSIVITSSTGGLKAVASNFNGTPAGRIAYTSAKHAVVGMMRVYASILAEDRIRVNTVHPTGVNTPMVVNDAFSSYARQFPDDSGIRHNAIPVGLIDPVDVSNAIVWLCSEDARYVTGTTVTVDAGFLLR